MSNRAYQLRAAHERAMDRVRRCEDELDRFTSYADMSDPRDKHTFLKLRADVAAAQRDAAWFSEQIDAALAVAGVDL